MHITVIICTYNRSASLRNALTSVAGLVLPESVEWEVLVVDNNSADQTREVIEGFCKQYPGRFRYLFEAKPGKSHALNAGIRDARGEILAFTDDDVTFAPMWLHNLTTALSNRGWAGVGGRIFHHWTCSRPDWLSVDGRYWRMSWPLTSFDLGEEACEGREGNKHPNGANMAFRKDIFARYGGFRTDLGPQPGNEIRCEDNEFGARLYAAGERIGYEPSAIAYHPVHQNRLTKKYFLAWWFDFGKGSVREMGGRLPPIEGCPASKFLLPPKEGCPAASKFQRARFVIWLMESTLRWMLSRSPAKRFYHKVAVWEKAGALIESFCKPQPVVHTATEESPDGTSRSSEAVPFGIPPSSAA
ncbi:MAG: glycosyltransferase [Terriglobales bacterium]